MESLEGSNSDKAGTGAEQVEDPLIAGLPPNTDYITYLTILEYQLTPQNLPTLNRLLQDDDGKLAAEIGWDLLKLVMPILRVEPDRAKDCLDIIARRGNPREVIIRVAEELATLGDADSDLEADPIEGNDGLPTFAGEAPRVHLGDMTLQGMPESSRPEAQASHSEHDEHGPNTAVEELKLQALLAMLGLLHPRIKTQHPSRFLATSLPAALSAYRRLSMNAESTSSFLNTLTKLATKKRPALPPRVSTANVLSTTSTNASVAADVVSAPLPDPESNPEKDTPSQAVASNEAAINERLIQAVLLEIIEEYTAASSGPQPPLTARLRARFEPHSITSQRRSQLDTLTANEHAKHADDLRRKFVTAAQDLKLDISTAIEKHNHPYAEEREAEEDNEYPTSPSQIPFSATGLLLVYSAQQYLQAAAQQPASTSNASTNTHVNTSEILEAIDRQYENDARLRQSAPAIDNILSLLYIIFCTPPSPTATQTHSSIENETLLLATYNILQDIFSSCPDADLRDNAYHIATHLLHGHCQRATRIKVIRGLLEAHVSSSAVSPIHEAQAGNLKSVAVIWLKDEIYPTQTIQVMMSRISDKEDRGLPLSVWNENELCDLIFPAKQVEGVPAAVSPDHAQEQQATETFAIELPFYISGLNLLCLFATSREEQGTETGAAASADSASGTSTAPPSTGTALDVALVRGEVMLEKLEKWKDYLVGRLSKGMETDTKGREGGIEVDGISFSDIFALEDAVGRAREVLASGE